MKHAPPESVKQRTVPAEVVTATGKQLKNMDGEVRAVVREEQEEKEVRVFSVLPLAFFSPLFLPHWRERRSRQGAIGTDSPC
jgi:hypothetical protein